MFELSAIVFIIISIIDAFNGSNKALPHFCVGLILIITSMSIKSHTALVQIKNYIGDSKKEDDESDSVEIKEKGDLL